MSYILSIIIFGMSQIAKSLDILGMQNAIGLKKSPHLLRDGISRSIYCTVVNFAALIPFFSFDLLSSYFQELSQRVFEARIHIRDFIIVEQEKRSANICVNRIKNARVGGLIS